ncbi:MAG: tRNA (N(6)-L-threonylcarbamoyladenosine(37)-C(2))-methylthiotransferase MtaB [Lachnospiraceae bacterium]|nr:tRNA (N(6)-L-threonylcarbamoyladenosine(37)-C(2))-methylthiotransferase MtaB [Lachnospiraceae bacterium]
MTLGCKVNYYETNKLSSEFEKAGANVVSFESVADIYVVNTCTVTNIADRKSRKMLHRAKRLNENALVVAIGCFAEANKESLAGTEGIDIVIGNDRKSDAYNIIMERYKLYLKDSRSVRGESGENAHKEEKERTRAYVKIQDGCNQFCSYCKIPYVRGRLKSRLDKEVIDEVKCLADSGYKEIVLTGIHLSSYGVDRSACSSFVELAGKPIAGLAAALAKIDGVGRIRFGSLEPRIITEDFIKEISGNRKVCPHFHLSLQSGCDKTLAAMNRKYTLDDYRKACGILRKYYDRPAITTDIIVGFPGETEEDFEQSMRFVREIGFSDIHVFKYSKRDGTRAARMEGAVPESVKHERSRRLIETGRELTEHYNRTFIGERQLCLVEEKIMIGEREYYTGHNERYVKMIIGADKISRDIRNEFVDVVPADVVTDNLLMCE